MFENKDLKPYAMPLEGIELNIEKAIVQILKDNEISLSQARRIFEGLIEDIERSPIK